MNRNLQAMVVNQRGPVAGVFRMRDAVLGETKTGRMYLRVRLEDMSGSLNAFAWREESYRDLYIQDWSRVYVEGQLRRHNNLPCMDLCTLSSQVQKEGGQVVRLIPQSLCPLPWLLPQLQAAVSRITIEPLARFVEAVLSNDAVAFAFVSAPASLNHHHNYPGGLLMHSLECFQMVERYREFSRESYELGLVSALFHDVGKTLTMTHDMQRTSLGYHVEHEKLNFEILGPYLSRLGKVWPQGANELRYLLNWKLHRRAPRYNMADLVACCDRVSTGLDMQKRLKVE